MKRALVPGTFDPITNGHLDVITRSARIFDEVVVAVAKSEKKNTLFSLEERKQLTEEAVADLPNVRVISFTGLLVDLANEVDAHAVVKGLRAITDFEYEFQMAAFNATMRRDVETLFIMSPPEYMYLSSSILREMASMGGDVSKYVPPCVIPAFRRVYPQMK
ncbi:MAG: pantetheine-phosphate adenylyltransferase [Eggerthellaceae bacterium]|jgi:pantetheine-phosphate adenylyltransferase